MSTKSNDNVSACQDCLQVEEYVWKWMELSREERETYPQLRWGSPINHKCLACEAVLAAVRSQIHWRHFTYLDEVGLGLRIQSMGDKLHNFVFCATGTRMPGQTKQYDAGEVLATPTLDAATDSAFQYAVPVDPSNIDLVRVKEWITYCDSQHEGTCYHDPYLEEALPHPTALILVDVDKNCLAMDLKQPHYLALSYVWGNTAESFQTTKSNFYSLCQPGGLASHMLDLPLTVRDTFHLARALNVPYVWVDRLCIIQDDALSKHENIKRMASVYARAYFTVIATDGDANWGLRGIGAESGPRKLGEGAMRYSGFHLGAQFNKIGCVFPVGEEPKGWHERGWTFQERAVSTRTLVFNLGFVFWQCREGFFQEYFGKFMASRPSGPGKLFTRALANRGTERYDVTPKPWADCANFLHLTREYFQKKFSFQADYLNGFMAIIQVYTLSFPGGFFFGLPEFLFSVALQWHPKKWTGNASEDWPSWSWLSIQGLASLELLEYGPHIPREDRYMRKTMAKWRKRCTRDGTMHDINDGHDVYEAWIDDAIRAPPPGWLRQLKEGAICYEPQDYDHRQRNEYPVLTDEGVVLRSHRLYHPLPLLDSSQSSADNQLEWEPLLFGAAWSPVSYSFDDKGQILNGKGECIGSFVSEREGKQVQDVIIIALTRSVKLVVTGDDSDDEINCMCLSMENGIAQRWGLGRIYGNAWDQMEIGEIEVIIK
ncbi:heterokaryon incompatibility protein-domain-containing protein [Stachybotrys elegans]|uniref:Heterokaryon incompatibility protein-domain-containing protein n=1 Tax=Stachybotrys elegans TaxID=80388 RepID=A0A8K0SIF4_9HYPO|nr:heterokaryon incompatibility protein-domain-containing protein [Stachybotrys elegans]